jgi:hypothetical protein
LFLVQICPLSDRIELNKTTEHMPGKALYASTWGVYHCLPFVRTHRFALAICSKDIGVSCVETLSNYLSSRDPVTSIRRSKVTRSIEFRR